MNIKTLTVLICMLLHTFGCFCLANTNAQQQQKLSLEDILAIAEAQSWTASSAKINAQISIAQFEMVLANAKPQLTLQATAPNFYRSSTAVTQPNGSISFQQIEQNRANLVLSAQQQISQTGGTISLQTDLTRFDDFSLESRQYNGRPFRLSLQQPLFGFRSLHWNKKLARLSLQEAESVYSQAMEETFYIAVLYYFQVLVAQENEQIASDNQTVAENQLAISAERLALGKISRDEHLQLSIQLESANLNQRNAALQRKQAEEQLWLHIADSKSRDNIIYTVPDELPLRLVEEQTALAQALLNRPEQRTYKKELLQRESEFQQTKRETGIQANLLASLGYSRGSERLEPIYTDPLAEQQLLLQISVPILDGGNRRSSIRRAEHMMKLTEIENEHWIADLEQRVRTRVREFNQQQSNVKDQALILELARQRFQISNDRFALGLINVTDWSIAQQEKNGARRAYIQALSDYWTNYYELRLLTSYDFVGDRSLLQNIDK